MPASALRERLGQSLPAHRLARRLGYRRGVSLPPPPRPVGVKLELTYRCNLKCPFCYTDSPRRTRERATDLDDAAWERLLGEVIELGAIEAVVTGGEPFLRRELALAACERLSQAGLGVTLNTNGWFVDDATADRLGGCSGLQVNVSLDGATPELHDGVRGVPGSWDRGVEAINRLLERGTRIRVIHVVTPANQRHVAAFLDQMWLLGVRSIRLAVVVPTGAAAREGDWRVDRGALRRVVVNFRARVGDARLVSIASGTLAALAEIEDVGPAALLVRPNGAVLIDSIKPFGFGNVRDQSLAACWQRILERWDGDEVVDWARSIRSADRMPRASVVPYLDEEVPLDGGVTENGGPGVRDPGGVPAGVPRLADGAGDLAAARRRVVGLALSRRYELGRVRSTGEPEGTRYVRVLADGRVCRLNGTASVVMDACASGNASDAVEALRARYRKTPEEQLERDALASVEWLRERGILRSQTVLSSTS